jgi:hypothetical protein
MHFLSEFVVERRFGLLEVKDTALVLIDVQGKLAGLMHDKETLFRSLRILIEGCKILEVPIYWLEQYPEGLGSTVPEVAELLTGETPLPKLCFSACGQDQFMKRLHAGGRQQLLLAGIETHICVYQTACDLLQQGYEVEVVADAVSSRKVANREVGLRKMEQVGARLSSVEMALFELLRGADDPRFKAVARLVR